MNRFILFVLLVLCIPTVAVAVTPNGVNGPVNQTGAVTANNVAIWSNNNYIKDSGFVIPTSSAPLPVSKGGTGSSTPSGTALDNITGFTGTGFLERTGAGTYSFAADPLPVAKGGSGAAALSGVLIGTGTTAFTAATLTNNATQYLNGSGVFATPSAGITNNYLAQSFTSVTSVVVNHGFGAYPVIQVIDDNKVAFIPASITHNSINQTTVTFSATTTGTILATLGSQQVSNYVSTAINYAVLTSDYYIEVTVSGKDITLPTAVGVTGKTYNIDNSSNGAITLRPTGAETIQGESSQSVPSESAVTVVSNGTSWRFK